jgi:lipid-binding SYLF domain-containing protein
MKRLRRTSAITLLLAATLGMNLGARADDLKAGAEEALKAFKAADSSLAKLLDEAVGYAIFPSVGKGGFIIGGQRGKGLVFQNGKAIGEATMTEVNIGAQIGGETFSELILFQTPESLRDFKASNWEMSARVSAVAASEGAAKAAKFDQGVGVFTLTKGGLMAAATVGGQKFKFKPLE